MMSPQQLRGARELRTAFWIEYDKAQQAHRRMKLANIIYDICSDTYFYNQILTCKPMVAYMVRPPKRLQEQYETADTLGLERAIEILESEFTTKGELDPRKAECILKAWQMVNLRRFGAIIQRVEQRNVNLNIDSPKKTPEQEASALSVEEIDKKLKELEDKAKEAAAVCVEYSIKETEDANVHAEPSGGRLIHQEDPAGSGEEPNQAGPGEG